MTNQTLDTAIFILTGLKPVEEITDEVFLLSLGTKKPLEIGYNKNRHKLPIETMQYSSRVAMLRTIAEMMEDEVYFITWLKNERC